MTIPPQPADIAPEAREDLFGDAHTLHPPIERHWFVPDAEGVFCRACNLPRANRRHAPKAA